METRDPLYDHHHAVQFYGDTDSLFTTVAGFLGQGFADGHPAIVIATPPHCEAILQQLKSRAVDVDTAEELGSLIVLDAQNTLDLFMDGGMPDAERFNASIGRLVADTLERKGGHILIRAYGEMVDVLWKQGKSEAAIRLEILWNQLAQRYGFALLCGYSMGHFYKQTKGFEDVCRQHTHIVAPAVDAARTRRRVS